MPAPRPDLFIVHRFLERLEKGPASRSALQRDVRLNYDLFRKYLAIVEERGLVAIDDKTCTLTAAGRVKCRELADWLRWLLDGE